MRKWIYGVGSPKGNEEIYLSKFRKHNQDALHFFKDRPNDLLIVSWMEGDGWGKLCPFLNKPIVNEPFPHVNKRKYL